MPSWLVLDPQIRSESTIGTPHAMAEILSTTGPYGMTRKAMVDNLLDGDTSRVGSYGARFAGVVFPGETLKASIWKEGDGFAAVVSAPERDDAVVLSGVELIPA